MSPLCSRTFTDSAMQAPSVDMRSNRKVTKRYVYYFIKLSNSKKKFLMPQCFSKLPCKMSAKDNGNVSRQLGAEASTAKDSVATAEEKMEKAQAQAPGHEVTMG